MNYSDDEILQAIKEHGSQRAAAVSLGIPRSTIQYRLNRRARKGSAPSMGLESPVEDGYLMGKVTVQRDKSGEVERTWARYSPEELASHNARMGAYESFASELPKVRKVSSPTETLPHLMAIYPIGDAHIGMRAWGEETQGEDWDMTIASAVQCGAMAALVDLAPAAEHAVIINLGDWFHADNMAGMTERSGHVMDLDGRYAKMIDVGVLVMRQCITSALGKHKTVRVINVVGNHDDTGALWLSVALRHAYANEPRVIIDKAPTAFNYIEHGKCLVGTHHGHTCKTDRLPGVMATDQAQAWGRTEHRYWYLGHVHHQSVKEFAGVTVESFNTLTAKDAWAAFGGYRARQNMKCIVLHSEFGEVSRHTVSPEMLK
jgi:hypothetical protein